MIYYLYIIIIEVRRFVMEILNIIGEILGVLIKITEFITPVINADNIAAIINGINGLLAGI